MFCPLPWTHLNIGESGNIRVCTHSKSLGDNNRLIKNNETLSIAQLKENEPTLNLHPLPKIRKEMLEGKWPDICRRCQIEYENNGKPRFQFEVDRLKNDFTEEMAKNITDDNGFISNEKVLFLDVRFGNTCNLKCMICHPHESNQWYDDYVTLNNTTSFKSDGEVYQLSKLANSYKLIDNKFDWANNKQSFDYILNLCKNVKHIYIGGGEPLLNKKHNMFIKKIIENGFSKNISLEYNSNVTLINDNIINLWNNFKHIKIGASVDSYGKINDILRYPSNWNNIENSLNILDDTSDNYEVYIATTVSILSIEHLIDWIAWLDNRSYKKIRLKDKLCGSHLLYKPYYMNIGILSELQKTILFNYLENKIPFVNFKTENGKNEAKELIQYYKNIFSSLYIEENEITLNRKLLIDFRTLCETKRNQNWSISFPVINQFINEWIKK